MQVSGDTFYFFKRFLTIYFINDTNEVDENNFFIKDTKLKGYILSMMNNLTFYPKCIYTVRLEWLAILEDMFDGQMPDL